MTDLSPTLKGILDHFSTFSDRVTGQPLTPFPKVGEPRSIISKDIANRFSPTPQLLVWDVYIPDLERKGLKECHPDFYVDQCNCKRVLVPTACMCKDCTNCAPFVQNRTAHSIFRRFLTLQHKVKGQVINPTLCYTVLTIPPHLRDKYLDSSAIKKVRKAAWAMLKIVFGARFGVESTHPIGDKSPLFHPHLNFLWIVRDGFPTFIDVGLLQSLWADILDVRMVNVWHQYSAELGQIFKWCEYVGRPFPGYSYWKGSIRWYGKPPKVVINKNRICLDCGGEIRRIGIIKASVVSDYYAHGWLIGLDPPWYSSKNLTPCRGSTKHGRTEHDERGVLRYEERQLSEASSDGVNRYGTQRSFA